MSEIASCPFCGSAAHPHINRQPGFTITVKCDKCHAEGPHVKFDPNQHRKTWDEILAGPRQESIDRWNDRLIPVEEEKPVLLAVDSA